MTSDRFIPRVVVVTLAVGVIVGLGSMAYLAMTQTAIPDQFDRLVTFLAGALAGILATTRGGSEDEPTSVVVENEPVEVEVAE